jgi:hypothetical protein
MIPPEVIIPHRVEDPHGSLKVNDRRNFRLFLAFVNKAVHGHHPSQEEAMLLESLEAVR